MTVARRCTVCQHPDREAVDAAIISAEPALAIAERFGLTRHAITRHAAAHVGGAVRAAEEARDGQLLARGEDLAREVLALRVEARAIGEAARSGDPPDLRTALSAIDRQARLIELQAKLLGDLETRATVDLRLDPDFARVRAVFVEAVQECPACRARVTAGLEAIVGADAPAPERPPVRIVR